MLPPLFSSFVLACLLIELTPGPNMTYLTMLSSLYGRRAGLSMVAGIAAGLLLVGLVSVFGMAALLVREPVLYRALCWVGTAYLLWLAIDNWRMHSPKHPGVTTFSFRYFRHGLVTNLLNPKAFLFYVTVFPLFINPRKAVLLQSLSMVFVYVAVATAVHGLIAVLGSYARPVLTRRRTIKRTRRVFSLVLVLIAVWFARTTLHLGA